MHSIAKINNKLIINYFKDNSIANDTMNKSTDTKYKDNIGNNIKKSIKLENITTVFLVVIVAPNVPNFSFCDNGNKKVRQ